jgi:homoserine dehydrogenase
MLENSPVDPARGQPALTHCRAALELGMHVITANKGALVHGYRSLSELARRAGRRFAFEATVLGGAPLFSVFRKTLPALELLSFRGVLNSTTNIVLTRMERGESLDEAVRYCQSVGVAETDPSADLDGWDAALKVAALATVLFDVPLTPLDVERSGIRDITPERIAEARATGHRWKLVCAAERVGGPLKARVAPELVPSADPLYGLEGSATAVTFRSDAVGDYTIIEGERPGLIAGPESTAYSLFADLLDAVGAQSEAPLREDGAPAR